jgi:Tfp pilus assembly protein PilF
MDCRKPLWLGLCLLSGAAGCASWGGLKKKDAVAAQPTPPGATAGQTVTPPPNAVVKKETEKDLPPRTPKASTCVAHADWVARESQMPERPQESADALRDQARKDYQQALSIDPSYLPAYQGLGRLYQSMGDQAHAIATLRKGIDVGPKSAPLWYDLGMCYLRQKDWEPAIQCLNKAVELDPENREYTNMLGHTLSRVGRYQESLTAFTRLYGEAKAYYNVARMLQHQNQPELCKQYLQTALKKDPNLEPARKMLAEAEGRGGAGVQAAGYTEPAKPSAPAPMSSPAGPGSNKAPAADGNRAPARSSVLMPPPPISFRPDNAAGEAK